MRPVEELNGDRNEPRTAALTRDLQLPMLPAVQRSENVKLTHRIWLCEWDLYCPSQRRRDVKLTHRIWLREWDLYCPSQRRRDEVVTDWVGGGRSGGDVATAIVLRLRSGSISARPS